MNQLSGIPKESEKIVVYWDASNSNMKNNFLNNAIKRAQKEERGGDTFSTGWTKYYFPDDFPEDYIAKAKEYDVEIGCWGRQKCQEMKIQFEEKMS